MIEGIIFVMLLYLVLFGFDVFNKILMMIWPIVYNIEKTIKRMIND